MRLPETREPSESRVFAIALKWAGLAIGILAVLLGGLWFLQGIGAVTVEPVMCVGECEALTGPSLPWAVAGILTLVCGGALAWFCLRRR